MEQGLTLEEWKAYRDQLLTYQVEGTVEKFSQSKQTMYVSKGKPLTGFQHDKINAEIHRVNCIISVMSYKFETDEI